MGRLACYNGVCQGKLSWGVRHADAFTHRFIKGFRVDIADVKPPIFGSPGDGSKQSQVSALPERRVKKQRLTALLGSYEHLRMLIFVCLFSVLLWIFRRKLNI